MAASLLAREMFANVGEITDTTGTNFTAVSGRLSKYPTGPYVSPVVSPGYSAGSVTYGTLAQFNPPSAVAGHIILRLSCWINFSDFARTGATVCPETAGHMNRFLEIYWTNNTSLVAVLGVSGSGVLRTTTNTGANADFGTALTKGTWYEIALLWDLTVATTSASFEVWTRGIGGTFAKKGSTQTYTASVSDIGRVGFANIGNSSTYAHFARVGAVSLYQLDSFSDLAVDSTANAPPATNQTIKVISTGSDAASGLDDAPLASIDELVTRVNRGYLLCNPSTTAAGQGDRITFDTTAANLRIGASPLFLRFCDGITLDFAGAGLINCSKLLGAVWSQDGTYTNLWKTTDSSATDLEGNVVWEDDVAPTIQSLSSAGSEVALLTLMNATVGFQCYSNGTTIYIRPSSGNPNSNGKVYERSRLRLDPFDNSYTGASAILIYAPYSMVKNLRGTKTCLCGHTTNVNTDRSPYVAYFFQLMTTAGGIAEIRNTYSERWSKHPYGATFGGSNYTFTDVGNRWELGNPYCGLNQAGPAYYNGVDTDSGNTVTITGARSDTNVMVAGSTGGSTNTLCASIISHHNSSGTQFSSITVRDSKVSSFLSIAATANIDLRDSVFTSAEVAATTTTVDGCRVTGGSGAPSVTGSGTITITNSPPSMIYRMLKVGLPI